MIETIQTINLDSHYNSTLNVCVTRLYMKSLTVFNGLLLKLEIIKHIGYRIPITEFCAVKYCIMVASVPLVF